MKRVNREKPLHRQTDDTRGRLVAAARDLFLEYGPVHFSLREVARRVGVSAPAIYRHFENKEALLSAACAEGFQVFSGYLVRALGESSAGKRLVATTDQYRRFGLENPLDYRFIFMNAADDAIKARPTGGTAQATTFRFLVDRVSECMAEALLAKDDPQKTAVVIWSHVHGLVALRLSGHLGVLDDKEFARLYRESVDGLIRGLTS